MRGAEYQNGWRGNVKGKSECVRREDEKVSVSKKRFLHSHFRYHFRSLSRLDFHFFSLSLSFSSHLSFPLCPYLSTPCTKKESQPPSSFVHTVQAKEGERKRILPSLFSSSVFDFIPISDLSRPVTAKE